MPSSAAWVQKLIDAARDRDIELSERDVQTINNASPESKLAKWARGTIQAEVSVIPENDEDLQEATRSIKASTAAVQSQTQVIENQTKNVPALRTSQVPKSNAHRRLTSTAVGQTQYIKSVNEDKTANLAHELQANLDQLVRDRKLHVATASQRLNADDRALELLHINDKPDDQVSDWVAETLARVEQLSRALISLRVDAVKNRLDRTYLEHSQKPPEPSSTEPLEQLKLEVQSLYTEIEDVATILVNHEHTARLNTMLHDTAASHTEAGQQAYSQTISQLRQLTSDIESLCEGLRTNHADRELAVRMTEHLDAIEAQRREHVSRPQLQVTRDGGPDPDTATIHLARRLQQLELQARQQQRIDKDPSQDFAALTSALSEAAERRKAAVHTLSSANQQPVSPNTDLRQLESEINKSRTEFEQLMASTMT